MDRRTFTTLALASVATLALAPAARAQEFGSAELIAAAKAEGKLVDLGELKTDEDKSMATLLQKQLDGARALLAEIDVKACVQDALASLASPAEKYQEAFSEFKTWLESGLIDQMQFDRLTSQARSDAFGERKLSSLVMAGSAKSQALRYDQSRGQAGSENYPKRQFEEQKKTNEALSLIAGYIRQQNNNGGAIQIVGF